jgi:hypothetical protein
MACLSSLPVVPIADSESYPITNQNQPKISCCCLLFPYRCCARLGLPVVLWTRVLVADYESYSNTSQNQPKIACHCLLFSYRCCRTRPACRPLDRSHLSGQEALPHYKSKPAKNLMLLSLVFLPLLHASACLSSL